MRRQPDARATPSAGGLVAAALDRRALVLDIAQALRAFGTLAESDGGNLGSNRTNSTAGMTSLTP